MSHEDVARILLAAFFVVIVGVRAFVQRRRTRDHGLRPFAMRVPSVAFFADMWWVLTTIAFSLAVALAGDFAPNVVAPPHATIGAAVALAGIGAAFASQLAMGASWRIGLQPGERTALVQHGPFAIVRNPIYSSVYVFLVGLALLVPNALMLSALAMAAIGVELQARLVEEPHLLATHGDTYRAYARRVGRFVPFVGRLRS